MYIQPKYIRTSIVTWFANEGEFIENKVRRILNNKEPIKDGAPPIYTERKDGVLAGCDVRTDRWEVAADAMDKVTASKIAERTLRGKGKETQEVNTEASQVADKGKSPDTAST